MLLPATGLQAAQTNTGCKCRVCGHHGHWMPESVQGAVEEGRELAASSHSAEGFVEHKKNQQDSSCLQAGGMWGWLEAALPAQLLPHTRSSLAEAGGQL